MRLHDFMVSALMLIAGLSTLSSPQMAWGLAGTLERPSISIPTVGDGKPDPVCSAIRETLSRHARQFVSGRFINAHSTMEFGGTAVELIALLKDLAAIEGAKLLVRFSEGSDNLLKSDVKSDGNTLPYQWVVKHNAWGDAQYLSVTILVGAGGLKAEDVQIPTIIGRREETMSGGDIPTTLPSEKQP